MPHFPLSPPMISRWICPSRLQALTRTMPLFPLLLVLIICICRLFHHLSLFPLSLPMILSISRWICPCRLQSTRLRPQFPSSPVLIIYVHRLLRLHPLFPLLPPMRLCVNRWICPCHIQVPTRRRPQFPLSLLLIICVCRLLCQYPLQMSIMVTPKDWKVPQTRMRVYLMWVLKMQTLVVVGLSHRL